MNPLYQQAIDGTLKSEPTQAYVDVTLVNALPFPVTIAQIGTNGGHKSIGTLPPNGTIGFKSRVGRYFWLQNAWSGSFIAAFAPAAKTGTGGGSANYSIDYGWLTLPNDIGTIPQPTKNRLIPPNSTMVLVGCGKAPSGNIITREQYWLRQPDSFSLAAGESKTSSISITHGLQDTSSESATVAASLGVSGSAGWGPISASVSASINASATVSHQVTVTDQTTAYESKTFTNQLDYSVMYIAWQLVDVITVYDASSGEPLATMSNGEPPSIIEGPFDPSNIAEGEQLVVPLEEQDVETIELTRG